MFTDYVAYHPKRKRERERVIITLERTWLSIDIRINFISFI